MKDTLNLILENALDFLEKSNDQFYEDPKSSIINFFMGLELIFKYRLAQYDYKLILTEESKNISANDFKSGKGRTLGIGGLLRLINDQDISEKEKTILSFVKGKSLKLLNHERNKLVHFFSDVVNNEDLEHRVGEAQIELWFHIENLVKDEWSSYFDESSTDRVDDIGIAMRDHNGTWKTEYAKVLGQLIDIKNSGVNVEECPYCKKESYVENVQSEIHVDSKCLVCDYYRLADEGAYSHYYKDSCGTRPNCSKCEEPETGVKDYNSEKYICSNPECYFVGVADDCQYCGENSIVNNIGDLDMSGLYGCCRCDGKDLSRY